MAALYHQNNHHYLNDFEIHNGENHVVSNISHISHIKNRNIHSTDIICKYNGISHHLPNQIENDIKSKSTIGSLLINRATKGFTRAFAAGYGCQILLALVPAILSRKRSWNRIRKILISADSLLFANICGLMSFTFNTILCLLRRYKFKESVWHKTLAGFISGIWVFLDNKQRRNKFALYCIIRALADLIRVLMYYKKLPNIKHGNVISFTASQMIIMYATFKDPKNLDPSYYKWIMNMGDLRESAVQNTMRSPSGGKYRLCNEMFMKCYPLYHNNPSCLMFNTIQWFATLRRAAKMYLPVHFCQSLLFKPKSICKNGWINGPIEFTKRKLHSTLISSIFLSTYVFNVKYTICLLRNIIRDDPAYVSVTGGLMSGLSLLIENPKRRSELMLYCIPKATEYIIHRIIREQKCLMLSELLQCNIFPTIAFQTALAIWLTLYYIPKGATNCNFINMKILSTIFGNNQSLTQDTLQKDPAKIKRVVEYEFDDPYTKNF